MEDYRATQIEALETLAEFNVRLLKNMEIIIKELSGERLDDTDAFLKDITDAMNWEIQVLNSTLDLINEKEQVIDKFAFNDAVTALAKAIGDKDDPATAKAFEGVIPFFKTLGEAASNISANA